MQRAEMPLTREAIQAERRAGALPLRAPQRFQIVALEVSIRGQGEADGLRTLSDRHAREGAPAARDRRTRVARWDRSFGCQATARRRADSAGGQHFRDDRPRLARESEDAVVEASRRPGDEQLRGRRVFEDRQAAHRSDHDATCCGGPQANRGARRGRDGTPRAPADLGGLCRGDWGGDRLGRSRCSDEERTEQKDQRQISGGSHRADGADRTGESRAFLFRSYRKR